MNRNHPRDPSTGPLGHALRAVFLGGILAGTAVLTPGCGGGGNTYQPAANTTLGRELQDLQDSYDKGIITQKQYEDTKKRLIKKYTD